MVYQQAYVDVRSGPPHRKGEELRWHLGTTKGLSRASSHKTVEWTTQLQAKFVQALVGLIGRTSVSGFDCL